MLVKCYVIDDEPLAVQLIEGYVKQTPFLELVGSSTSAIKALEEIKTMQVDLLFLDIEMSEMNGMDLCEQLPKDIRVIFTTAYSQYAVESYRKNALDYLLKPISYCQFLCAATKILSQYECTSSEKNIETIFVKSESKLKKIKLKEVLYIEGLKDYVKIHLNGGQPSVVSLMSMKSLEEMLSTNNFMRVHRSYIVNLNNVDLVERGRIVFGKNYIPISETNRDEFMARLSNLNIICGK
ncbi:MAG: response regulator transcription factor [Bacteroidales bacterium]|nr:response regulator transcription factor [Bacteroidales bacterium]